MVAFLSFWLLLAAPDRPGPPVWVIVGVYDGGEECETVRSVHAFGDRLICARHERTIDAAGNSIDRFDNPHWNDVSRMR